MSKAARIFSVMEGVFVGAIVLAAGSVWIAAAIMAWRQVLRGAP